MGISHLDVMWVVTETRRANMKRGTSKNKSSAIIQMYLF